jgi:hypothetical protein
VCVCVYIRMCVCIYIYMHTYIRTYIRIDYIDEWIIVYNGNRIEKKPYIFEKNKKIKRIHI